MSKFSEALEGYIERLKKKGLTWGTIRKEGGVDRATIRDWIKKGFIPRNATRLKEIVKYIENILGEKTNLIELYENERKSKGARGGKTNPLLTAYRKLRKTESRVKIIEDIAKTVNRAPSTIKAIIWGHSCKKETYLAIARYLNTKLGTPIVPIRRKKVPISIKRFYRELRKKEKGLTFKDITRQIGISVGVLRHWIYDGIIPKNKEVVERVARFFSEKLGKRILIEDVGWSGEEGEEIEVEPSKPPYVERIEKIVRELELLKQEGIEELAADKRELIDIYDKLGESDKKEIMEIIKLKIKLSK